MKVKTEIYLEIIGLPRLLIIAATNWIKKYNINMKGMFLKKY